MTDHTRKAPSVLDRRTHARASAPLIATVFGDGRKIGDYLLQNLSAGGALLINGPPLVVGAPLFLVLQGACGTPFRVGGVVLRSELNVDLGPTAAVAFRGSTQAQQDLLQDLVLRALECEHSPGVLVFDHRPYFLALMTRDLVALRRRVILAMTELELVRCLSNEEACLSAVVVDLARDPMSAFETLDVVRHCFPGARRIAACALAYRQELAQALARTHAQSIIDVPWTRDELSSALQHNTNRPSDSSASARSVSSPP